MINNLSHLDPNEATRLKEYVNKANNTEQTLQYLGTLSLRYAEIALAKLNKLDPDAKLVFDETMKLMGGAATAIALLALGGTLDLSRISSIYNMIKATWQDCLIKLVIHPLILWALLLALSVPEPLLKVTVMLSSMPSAVNCFIMAKEMKMDSDYAADLVASTTVLGIISIPVWANLLGII